MQGYHRLLDRQATTAVLVFTLVMACAGAFRRRHAVYSAETLVAVPVQRMTSFDTKDPLSCIYREGPVALSVRELESSSLLSKALVRTGRVCPVQASGINVEARALGDTNVIQVLVESRDPVLAAEVANNLTDLFRQEFYEQEDANLTKAIRFIREQYRAEACAAVEAREELDRFARRQAARTRRQSPAPDARLLSLQHRYDLTRTALGLLAISLRNLEIRANGVPPGPHVVRRAAVPTRPVGPLSPLTLPLWALCGVAAASLAAVAKDRLDRRRARAGVRG